MDENPRIRVTNPHGLNVEKKNDNALILNILNIF